MFSVLKNSENEMVIKHINNIFFFERKKKTSFLLGISQVVRENFEFKFHEE